MWLGCSLLRKNVVCLQFIEQCGLVADFLEKKIWTCYNLLRKKCYLVVDYCKRMADLLIFEKNVVWLQFIEKNVS